MNATGLSRVALAFLIMGVLVGGIALGRVVTAFNPTPSTAPSATPSQSSSGSVGLPDSDVVGEDIARLPRYPGSVRTEYAVSVDERYQLTITEFMVDAPLEEVRLFYQSVIEDQGWERADINYSRASWTYILVDSVDGRTEALIELACHAVYRRPRTMIDERRADRRWRTAVVAIGGLLIAIAVIGVVGILINRNIHQTVENAIAHDVELEDRGDDLRVAILEVRHYHRDLLLNNPDPTRVELWQNQYRVLTEEIAAVEEVIAGHPARAQLPDVREIGVQAEDYYAAFAEAVADEITDLVSFRNLATGLLVPLDEMESVAVQIDRAGEERAAAAFTDIDRASTTGNPILIAVILGLGAMGGVLGVAVLRLVQDQRRLVAVEQAVVVQMAEASRAKTDFIADASHELRTPLTVLRGNAEVGLALQDDCAHGEILHEIVAESARMSRLVDDLLFLARSDASSVPLELREIDSHELMTALATRAEVLTRELGASLTTSVHGIGSLHVDPRRVEQAILILIDNAAKYGSPGGDVELDARITHERLAVELRDRGPGIPVEQQGRVFERFYRADSPSRGRSSGGAGLGLPIAAAIIEGHGGEITASDRPDGGTVMTVSLPIAAQA